MPLVMVPAEGGKGTEQAGSLREADVRRTRPAQLHYIASLTLTNFVILVSRHTGKSTFDWSLPEQTCLEAER